MAAAAASALTLFVVTFAVILNTTAADPEMLQDVCVADLSSLQACRRARLKFNIMGAQNHSAGALSRVAATLYRSPSQVA
ncbi:hypothetical protein WN944_023254 [Citrus x changshan-huyou]|uniref:Pectinesterase inhibitor domain-containing protein n=1 Tax=Citrus x changshan-huyou TaxID=2935761 RepID=A0AAP0N2V9_9ROSI